MGFDDRLWLHLVEEHDAHLAIGPARSRGRSARARSGVVIAAGAVVAVALLAVVLTRSPQSSAWSAEMMQRAAAVLEPKPSSQEILHISVTQTMSPLAQKDRDTHIAAVTEEGWLQQGSPYQQRVILHPAGGPVYEETNVSRIYNLTNHVVYAMSPMPSGRPRYTVLPGPTAATKRLRVSRPNGWTTTTTISSATLRSLRAGTDEVDWITAWNGHVQSLQVAVLPTLKQMRRVQSQQPNPGSLSFASQLRGLLASGHARVTRTTTDDGEPAIEIASVHPQSGPRTTYYVNPTTYAPIELDSYGYDSPDDVTRVKFHIYQIVPLSRNRNFLRSTTAASARVDRTPADYWKAAGVPRPF